MSMEREKQFPSLTLRGRERLQVSLRSRRERGEDQGGFREKKGKPPLRGRRPFFLGDGRIGEPKKQGKRTMKANVKEETRI